MDLAISPSPLSRRRFHGLGVQADSFYYDDFNRQAGVTEDDCRLIETRLKALRPGVARIFLPLSDFNPALDGRTYDWDRPAFRDQLRNLRVLREAGAAVNVCMGPWTNREMRRDGMESAAVDVVEHLIRREGLDNIRWLCLFNEPDTLYRHDSPLYERLFANRPDPARPPWADYVAKHRRTQALLEQRGLYPSVRLVVADTVWGYAMRRERIELARRDFGGMDVGYSFHNYIVDAPGFYDGNPDFCPPGGMEAEARSFRRLLGPRRELICWEFNDAGYGFGSAFPGTGPHGEDLLGSFDSAAGVSDKVLAALVGGADGLAVWCLCDMFYRGALKQGVMHFGLWRFKWCGWRPRPVWYYFAALVHAFRPGASLHRVRGARGRLRALAAHDATGWAVALLHRGARPRRLRLRAPAPAGGRRLRVCPERLPAEGSLPLDDWADLPAGAAVELELAPNELTVLRFPEAGA